MVQYLFMKSGKIIIPIVKVFSRQIFCHNNEKIKYNQTTLFQNDINGNFCFKVNTPEMVNTHWNVKYASGIENNYLSTFYENIGEK